MTKALLLVALVGCTDAPGFAMYVTVDAQPVRTFDFATIDDARSMPPKLTIENTTFAVTFACDFQEVVHETPKSVYVSVSFVETAAGNAIVSQATQRCDYDEVSLVPPVP